ncbi:MAG TPA: flagellar motor protein MotB [Blastocatellia bacterium]|nr:flagellar motor protein MotB [Blastocatellia bacterium]
MKAATAGEPEKKPRRRIKKVAGHGGHHGGAWKVAYADFVTAMMALFLVLWLVSQADTKLKQSLANYFRSPGIFTASQGGIMMGGGKVHQGAIEAGEESSTGKDPGLISAAAMLHKEIEKDQKLSAFKDQVKIEMTEEGLRIQILDKAERVSFDSGSAQLTGAAREILSEVAQAVCNLPNPIFISGHTDRRLFPPGSTYTNWELSADRANAARRALEASCVKPEQVKRVIGHADTEPLIPSDPYATANRRISITVSRHTEVPNQPKSKTKTDQSLTPAAPTKTESIPAKSSEPPLKTPALPGASSEEKLRKAKLANEGSVTIGEADKVPEGVKRTKESKSNEH